MIVIVGVDARQESVDKFSAVAGEDPVFVIYVEENSHNWLDCKPVEKVPWIPKFLLGTLF